MVMRWPWSQPEPVRETNHVERIPDGDRVLGPGQPSWADLLSPAGLTALGEATQPLPLLAPLMTPLARWRGQIGGRRGDLHRQ
jgi:hypothetical protein